MSLLFNTICCPVCNAATFTKIQPATYPDGITERDLEDMYRSSSDHILMDQLSQCSECDLIYINPQVKQEIIEKSYINAVDNKFITQNQFRIATFKRNLKWICKKLHIAPTKSKKILDVGCAGGAFPYAADQLGFSVVGVEPSTWLAKNAKEHYDLDIRAGMLHEQKFIPNSFEVISLWDVIEHLVQPKGTLKEIHSLLKTDGYFVINYPNYDSVARKFFGRRWPFFLSVHLIYFAPVTLNKLLESCGFKVVLEKPYWQSLELGYVLNRAGAYFKPFLMLAMLFEKIGISKLPLTYNLGQTLVVAKKINADIK